MKVACTVRSGGKAGDDIKRLPIAIVYGIAITAMSFFTDPTISTLTSGTPNQNVDLGSLSFPRRMGIRFHQEFLKRYHLMGMQAKWTAYEDKDFKKKLGKEFNHEDMVSREGWAMYYFDGKFSQPVAYIHLQIVNPQSNQVIRNFYFEFRKSYQTTFDSKRYVMDPVLGEKIVKNGILTELKPFRKKDSDEIVYRKANTTFERTVVKDILEGGKTKGKVQDVAIIRNQVRYSEKPKMVFLVTPPHLMKYAKLILILIKQLVSLMRPVDYKCVSIG